MSPRERALLWITPARNDRDTQERSYQTNLTTTQLEDGEPEFKTPTGEKTVGSCISLPRTDRVTAGAKVGSGAELWTAAALGTLRNV